MKTEEKLSTKKPRLAFVAPHFLGKDEIVKQAEEILTELRCCYDVDLVVSQHEGDRPDSFMNLPTHSVDWFSNHAHLFDRVVYLFANTPSCAYMLPLLEKVPGAVVLNDFYLSQIYAPQDGGEIEPQKFSRALYESHGYYALAQLKEKGQETVTHEYPCNRAVIEQSKGVIILHEHIIEQAKSYYGDKAYADWKILTFNAAVSKTYEAKEGDIPNKDENFCANRGSSFYNAIEEIYSKTALMDNLIEEIAKRLSSSKYDDFLIKEIAQCLALSFHTSNLFQTLYLDLSGTIQCDHKTGIQRVARALTQAFVSLNLSGIRIAPVYLKKVNENWFYFHAHHYICNSLDIPTVCEEDEPIDARKGDIVVHLDIAEATAQTEYQNSTLQVLINRGVSVYSILYDLIPIRFPHYYIEGFSPFYKQWLSFIPKCSGVVCISHAVADDFRAWCAETKLLLPSEFKIFANHLGADISNSFPSSLLPDNATQVLSANNKRITFLMVGTIEPRKRHAQVLAAFENIWRQGIDVNLIIVGKNGWMVESLTEEIINHHELNHRLFWLSGVSDEFLETLYREAHCLIFAAEAEGFGLPLIEAAQHKLPIITRDIPVFREVAGDHAFYFSGKEPQDLANAIQEWIALYKEKKHPLLDNMPYLTWEESAKQLLEKILPKD